LLIPPKIEAPISFAKVVAPTQIAPILSSSIVSEEVLLSRVLQSVVRINDVLRGTAGSGVVIWSGKDRNTGLYHTFVVTNEHVIQNAEVLSVDFFEYLNFHSLEKVETYPGNLRQEGIKEDLALISVVSSKPLRSSTPQLSLKGYEELPLYTDVFIVGCGLSNPPFISKGEIISFENNSLITNGFSVFGFSGGGVFTLNGELVAISNKIGMVQLGESNHPVTNMSISIPVFVMRKWLLEGDFAFIVNNKLGSLEKDRKSVV